MNKRIYFLFFSAIAGIFCYFWVLPQLPESPLLHRFFNWIYQSIWVNFYEISETTFLISLSVIAAIIFYLILEVLWLFADGKPLTSRGSARWANKADIKDLLLQNEGVPVGKFNNKILHINKHLVTCAGTGAGKGVGAIIPALLEYPESVICLDIKGENYAITARRRREFGPCYAINPFNLLNIKTNSFNWLDVIDINDESCIDKAFQIASQLVGDQNKNSNEDYFNTQAKRLLQGVILAVCTENEDRNICTVSDLIHNLPFDKLCTYLKSKGDAACNVISSVANQFANNTNDKEISGILGSAQKATNFLDNPGIRKTLSKSDFNILELPDKIMSVYLIIPQDKIKDYPAYIRIFFDLAFSSLVSRNECAKHKVLFLLDEVALLGYMKSFADQISFIRGLGGQLWFLFQSYAQLKNIYGDDADNILSNSSQIFYGCNDMKTAELISKTLGKKTVREYKKDGSYIDVSQDLLTPDQVRLSSPKNPILIVSGKYPIKLERLTYFKDKEYKKQFDKNPYLQ